MRTLPGETEVERACNDLMTGRTNAGGVVTLRTSETTTTIQDRAIQAGDFVLLFPVTADAVADPPYGENGAATAGAYVLTHSSDSTTRTYRYVVTGD